MWALKIYCINVLVCINVDSAGKSIWVLLKTDSVPGRE